MTLAAVHDTARAVFLDRDGTIIVDKHYLGDPVGAELESGAAAGLARLALLGLRLIGVTNQSGIAKGLFDLAAAQQVNARVDELLVPHGVSIERWYLCPHNDGEGCICRKPAPGLVLQAARELGVDPARSFVIGDKLSDVALAEATGGRGILVETGKGVGAAAAARDLGFPVVSDLEAAAALIAAELAQGGVGNV
jgi:histidinol-phosphate phosphatase family protein